MKLLNCVLAMALSAPFLYLTFAFTDFDTGTIAVKTYEDAILWAGCRYPKKFDPVSLKGNDSAKKEALIKGLDSFEKNAKNGSIMSREVLAGYYCTEGMFKEGLEWANTCVKNGSSKGMYFLYEGYSKGQGVIQDLEESTKWLFLSVALENEDAIKKLEERPMHKLARFSQKRNKSSD